MYGLSGVATVTRRRGLFDARPPAHRRREGISRFQIGGPGEAFSASRVDVEPQVSFEAVAGQGGMRPLAHFDGREGIALEEVAGRRPFRLVEQEDPRAP